MKTLTLGRWLEISIQWNLRDLGFGVVLFFGHGNLDLGILFWKADLNIEVWWPVAEAAR